ncbi:MAG TPA: protein kinase [Candidatus Acidoferrales bacterium]|jgi:serine/threonine protein kinase/tetratricopeptide (TPR) repeat protein|nr:protein kinase [Candidatus Acidoferrales bacterium]
MTLSAGGALSHYRIIAPLGAGGMGEVYLAEDTKLKRQVAIKVLSGSVLSDPGRRRRFLREARVTSALNHPNVAQIYEIGEEEGTYFLVLEYVEGQTLSSLVRTGPLPVPRIVEIVTQLADALSEAHAKGIIHRDLKPENIMLSLRGQAKILDFGIAKISYSDPESEETRTLSVTLPGSVVGTVAYMSPEQALGRELDPRSDLFSLGVVLYKLASGKLPFTGKSTSEILGNIVHVEPAPLALNDDTGRKLAAIIWKCLAKDPDRRYQSAGELLADLQPLHHEPVVQQSAGLIASRQTRRALWMLQHPALALSPFAAVLVALLAYFAAHGSVGGRINSLAVLPFENASGDPKLDYLTDGLTESLINDLSRLPGVRTLSYAAVQHQKGKNANPRDAGQQMNVNVVLSGGLVRQGDSPTVRVDLIDVKTGAELWGHHYNRELMALLDVQQEITREVGRRLQPGAGSAKLRAPGKAPAGSEAYDLYLRGRFAVNQRTNESIKNGLVYFRQSIDKEPANAQAWAGMAIGYVNMAFTGTQPATIFLPQARAAAAKALTLDPDSVDAHCQMGYLKVLADYDWRGAEKEFKTALALDPNHALSHELFAMWVLAPTRREAEALSEINHALDADPGSIMVNFHRGFILYYFRRYDEAVKQFERAVAIDPAFLWPHMPLGLTYIEQHRYQEAIAQENTPPYSAGGQSRQLTTLAYAYAVAGDRNGLDPLLKEMEQRAREGYVPPFNMARIYAVLGQKERAFQFLEQGYVDRDPGLVILQVDPTADVFHSDPRYQDLLRRMGLNN